MGTDFTYELKIEFGQHPVNPSNIFYSMGELIDSMNTLDKVLLQSLPCTYTSDIILESITAGSIKTRLKTLLLNIDDDAIRELDWKKLIGAFLFRAKYKIIESIDNIESINTKGDLKLLTDSIEKIAYEEFGTYNIKPTIPSTRLLDALSTISGSMKQLKKDEKAIYICSEGSIVFNKNFNLSQEDIETLLTEKKITSTTKEILVVKKPDYLGQSKWEFYTRGKDKIFHIKILDHSWLIDFQSGNIDLRPGDLMEVSLETIVSLDIEMKEVNALHYLHKVFRVLNNREGKFEQLTLL